MRESSMPAMTRKACLPVDAASRSRAACTRSAGNSPVTEPTGTSVSPAIKLASWCDVCWSSSSSSMDCASSRGSDVIARYTKLQSTLQFVILNLRQQRLVADAQSFGGARLVAVVRAEGCGDLAPLNKTDDALRGFSERARRVQ